MPQHRSGGVVQDGADPASVQPSLTAADSGRSQRKYLLPLVSGIHAAGGNTAFFHGELYFRHRFTEETVDWVFARILDEVAKAGYHFRTENLKRRNPLNHRIKWHFLPTEVPEEPKYSKKRRLHPITIPAMVRLRLTPQNYSDVSFNGVA